MAHKVLMKTRKKRPLVVSAGLLQRRRAQVTEAAFDLFRRSGFRATGIREIASESGLSPAAILTYFRDKEEIIFTVIDQQQAKAELVVADLVERIEESRDRRDDPRRALAEIVEAFVRAIGSISGFVVLAYQETKSLRPKLREELFARERRVRAAFERAIRWGVDAGCFSPRHVPVKAHSIIALAHAWALRRWALEGVASVDEYAAIVQELVSGMLVDAPGLGGARISREKVVKRSLPYRTGAA